MRGGKHLADQALVVGVAAREVGSASFEIVAYVLSKRPSAFWEEHLGGTAGKFLVKADPHVAGEQADENRDQSQ